MKKLIWCDKCGYYAEVEAILFDKCPNCNTPLIIDDKEADENIANGIIGKPSSSLEIMKNTIEEFGNDNIWYTIETISEVTARIEERQLFLEAGGKVPTHNIKGIKCIE